MRERKKQMLVLVRRRMHLKAAGDEDRKNRKIS